MSQFAIAKPDPALIPHEAITVRLSPDDQLALAYLAGLLPVHAQLLAAMEKAPDGGVLAKAFRENSFGGMSPRLLCETSYAKELLEFVPNKPYKLTPSLVSARIRSGMPVAQALGDPVEKTVRELFSENRAECVGLNLNAFAQRLKTGTPLAAASSRPATVRGSRKEREAYARYCAGRFDVPRFSLYHDRLVNGENLFDASRPPAGVPLKEWRANVGRPSWRSWKKVQAAWDAAVADGMDMTPYEEAGRATQAALDDIPATGDEKPDPNDLPETVPGVDGSEDDDAPLANASV